MYASIWDRKDVSFWRPAATSPLRWGGWDGAMPPRQGHLNRNDTISADPISLRHDSPALLSDAANGTPIHSEDGEAVGSLVPGIMPRKNCSSIPSSKLVRERTRRTYLFGGLRRCSVKHRVRHPAPSRSLQFTTRQAAATMGEQRGMGVFGVPHRPAATSPLRWGGEWRNTAPTRTFE